MKKKESGDAAEADIEDGKPRRPQLRMFDNLKVLPRGVGGQFWPEARARLKIGVFMLRKMDT